MSARILCQIGVAQDCHGLTPMGLTGGEGRMFNQILDKIREAHFIDEPFRHLEITDLFDPGDFDEIIQSPEVALDQYRDDKTLIQSLEAAGWKPIPFPGTTENVDAYLKWHNKGGRHTNINTCEGFGVTFRLYEFRSKIIADLEHFLMSAEFQNVLCEKFSIDRSSVDYDAGIQKYLDGYEISPHPDIRKKALTYMVNINPAPESEQLNYHTHYMKLRPPYKYICEYWRHNPASERCWVPWDWCETIKQQTRNNSMVIFSPDFNTLHAVKARYDHLATQRTQLYGNFWLKSNDVSLAPAWDDYVIRERTREKLKRMVPSSFKEPIKLMLGRTSKKAGKRAIDVFRLDD